MMLLLFIRQVEEKQRRYINFYKNGLRMGISFDMIIKMIDKFEVDSLRN